jgi:mono/diheme cytochrome c family protein
MRRLIAVTLSAFVAPALFSLTAPAQQPTAEQRQLLGEANKLKTQISSRMTSRRYDEAAKSLEQLETTVKRLKDSGVSDKDAALQSLWKFVENQKKILQRHQPKEPPKQQPAAPTKPAEPDPASTAGGVSYVRDVAPIFARNCAGCHGTNNPRNKFSVNTYNSLMAGGERGDDIVPGKPEESLLVLLLKGEEQPRMPRNRALRDDLIEKVELWVKQGAKFDGTGQFTPETPLAQIVPSADEELKTKVAAMSESDLLELHKTRAKEHWQVANPSKSPDLIETDHFIVMGTLTPEELEQGGRWAEAALRDLSRIFGPPAHDAVWKGKLTIHLFAERHEYTEHAMMVENRELPAQVHGHNFRMIETSYAALPKPPDGGPLTLKSQLVEQLAGAYLAALGDTPRWFNVGVGRYLAARSDGKAEIYRQYRQQIREAVVESGDAAGLVLDEKGDPDLLGFGLIDFLVSQRQGEKALAALATQLRQKAPADKAIQSVYGLDRAALASAWSAFAAKRYPVKKR